MTNAVIGHHNVLLEETVTVSSEATGFEKENAYDSIPIDFWKPTASPAWLKASGRMPLGMWLGSTVPETITGGVIDDLTPNDNDAAVTGSVVASAVASNAELMGFSGWGVTDYAEVPYDSNLDFGDTGDFTIEGNVNFSSLATIQVLFDRSDSNATNRILIQFSSISDRMQFAIYDGAGSFSNIDTEGFTIETNVNYYMVFKRSNSGTVLSIYINGSLITSETVTVRDTTSTDSTADIRLGISTITISPAVSASLSLWAIYGEAFSDADVLENYNARKSLYEPNSEVDNTLLSLVATSADYFAMYGHDFAGSGSSVVLQYSDDDSAWTDAFSPVYPATSAPVFEVFTRSSHEFWRILTTGDEQQIGVATFGKSTELQRGLSVGFEPMALGSENKPINSESAEGDFLGRSTRKRPVKGMLNFNNLTPSWVRANWPELLADLEQRPFFVLPSPDNFEDEPAFCWTTGPIKTPRYGSSNLMSISLPINSRIS